MSFILREREEARQKDQKDVCFSPFHVFRLSSFSRLLPRSNDDLMGNAVVPISKLLPNKSEEFVLTLQKARQGVIVLQAEYRPTA